MLGPHKIFRIGLSQKLAPLPVLCHGFSAFPHVVDGKHWIFGAIVPYYTHFHRRQSSPEWGQIGTVLPELHWCVCIHLSSFRLEIICACSEGLCIKDTQPCGVGCLPLMKERTWRKKVNVSVHVPSNYFWRGYLLFVNDAICLFSVHLPWVVSNNFSGVRTSVFGYKHYSP